MSHWNYRLIHHEKRVADMYHDWYAVHEVYYREDGTIKAVSAKPAVIIGDSVKDANGTRVLMFGAFKAPPLEMADIKQQRRKERASNGRSKRSGLETKGEVK